MLKVDIINQAYVELRISGITVDPTPEDLEWGLIKLEAMAAEFAGRNICGGYNFEEEPDPNCESGLSIQYQQAYTTNLAVRLAAAFGKVANQHLNMQASQSLSGISALSAAQRQTTYPSRQPIGSGNSRLFTRFRRFYPQTAQAPISCDTQQITRNETNDYTLKLYTYLEDGESISGYTQSSTEGLTIGSSALNGSDIDYRVQCSNNASSYEYIDFTVSLDSGREKIFRVNFNVTGSREV